MYERITQILITDVKTFFSSIEKKLKNLDGDRFSIVIRKINRKEVEHLLNSHILISYLNEDDFTFLLSIAPIPMETKEPSEFWKSWEIVDFDKNPVLLIDSTAKRGRFYFVRFK